MRSILICSLLSWCTWATADDPVRNIEGWGDVIDPDRDSVVQLNDGKLTIEYGPGRHALDAENGRMNAPRVLQSLEDDFSIQVTVEGDLPLPELDGLKTRGYISGGIVLIQDQDNYIRLERASFTRQGNIWHYTNFEQRIAAKRTRMGRFADFPLQPDKPVELRLEVKGEKVRALVRHVGDDWHDLGIARIKDRGQIFAGVSGVKTNEDKASVSFRDLQLSEQLVAAEAKSESEIDLNQIRQIIRVPQPANVQWKVLLAQVEELHSRAKKVGQLSPQEQTQLINDGKKLGTLTTPKLKAYLGPSIARRLAENFQQADLPEQSIRVYREFADALERLREPGLDAAIESLRESAKQLESEPAGDQSQ